MLNILSHCKKVAPSLLRAQFTYFIGVCPAVAARGYSRSSFRILTANVVSGPRCCHAQTSGTKRYHSENYTDSSISNSSVDAFQKESHVTDNDSNRSSFSLDVLVSLLRQENAVDICVIKIPDSILYTEYVIVVSGISTRHLQAMALYAVKVYKYFKKEKERNVKIEGKETEDWMCIDFGNMVVHFMLPETRELYELEKLWTLRGYDEQLRKIPPETLPEDFIYDDLEVTK
ncbi:mitochondrial assembly of ribosomal large subunit protein 1 [Takifugu flavidus]|uniref:mitochondrial assembly of ribosomal large subunit protein 1 n=1 Tax=Takifugu flavidus TaxID=433684 RepID=UPI00254445FD|nr:mitochondrial assembly of ribosomal large subunit protein 1 [Takifugu flavidus]